MATVLLSQGAAALFLVFIGGCLMVYALVPMGAPLPDHRDTPRMSSTDLIALVAGLLLLLLGGVWALVLSSTCAYPIS